MLLTAMHPPSQPPPGHRVTLPDSWARSALPHPSEWTIPLRRVHTIAHPQIQTRPVPRRTLAHPNHIRIGVRSHLEYLNSQPSALHPFDPPPYLSPSMILCSPFLNDPPLSLPSSPSSPSLSHHSISAQQQQHLHRPRLPRCAV
ncbi:hypothetical protein BDN70DRAFT_701545 [Pholiota conissans]|uniref:Uncharacterized protein n=1 Tax=Pholiota conissans TaxID=109636 RepID=A0A9P5Z4D4_9AGAR|nr:hypothetical protein BDN70DRAFT_701545 [Pholiota conissans]